MNYNTEDQIRANLEPQDFYIQAIERILEWPDDTLQDLIASGLASEVLRGVCRNTGLFEYLDEESSQQMIDHSKLTKAFRSILEDAMKDCMEDEVYRCLYELGP